MSLGGILSLCAYLFLAGSLMVVLSPIPAFKQRVRGLLGIGFSLAVLSLLAAVVATIALAA